MVAVALCEAMHWTYQQYLEQPTWFLELLKHKMRVDADNAKSKAG